ncbi:O-methyltransferase [Rarobacter incanus]|uniref:Putative O-methyltransferase YrrM n=1 Tax=Rarobacter incanus TaxID=153494 RepID=A0A542SNG8_9MICO|nr:methyltransferase domain-containing protein [Rarobacter incanus]TQK76108.1 putative O-methyltransferase YrrM [Rarobacter incanus]
MTDAPGIEAARERAGEYGMAAISRATGAVLRVIAAAMGARTVVEVGTGAGITAQYLLEAMPADGVVTTIDAEAEHQRQAKVALREAGIGVNRTRPILGRPLEVLPRLADAAYDIVVLSERPEMLAAYTDHVLRILRPGGAVIVLNALWHDAVADPARRDEPVVALRQVIRSLHDDERLFSAIVPVGAGILVGTKR